MVSGTETLLYLIGVPAVVVAVIWALAYRGGSSVTKRYRPERHFAFTPVWYLANHETGPRSGRPALETDRGRPALPAAVTEPASDEMRKAVGGASGSW